MVGTPARLGSGPRRLDAREKVRGMAWAVLQGRRAKEPSPYCKRLPYAVQLRVAISRPIFMSRDRSRTAVAARAPHAGRGLMKAEPGPTPPDDGQDAGRHERGQGRCHYFDTP